MDKTRLGVLAIASVAVVIVLGFSLYFPTYFVPPSRGDRAIMASEFRNGTASGLRLGLQSTPHGNGSISIDVEENNTMSVDQPVQAADSWAYPPEYLNPYDGCGSIPALPIGVAVFQGHYTLANFSQAKALVLYDTKSFFTCTTILYPVVEYDFIANGYRATVIDSQSQVMYLENVTLPISVTGYWTGGAGTSEPATLHSFHGDYTVLAADEWGAVDLEYFTAV